MEGHLLKLDENLFTKIADILEDGALLEYYERWTEERSWDSCINFKVLL